MMMNNSPFVKSLHAKLLKWKIRILLEKGQKDIALESYKYQLANANKVLNERNRENRERYNPI